MTRLAAASLCVLLGCVDDGEASPMGDALSSGGGSSSTDASTSTSDSTGSTSTSGATGSVEPVTPLEGLWRWNSYGDVLDGCSLSFDAWDYGLTLVDQASSTEFTLTPWGGTNYPCTLTTAAFECDPNPLQAFPDPAASQAEFDGTFVDAQTGSMAFRSSATCDGPTCPEIAMMAGIEFPCESTALTEGLWVAEVELPDEGCDSESTLVSTMTPEQALVTFVNETAEDIQLFWLDFTGARSDYGVVPAGETRHLWTFLTHAWLIANPDGECQSIHLPTDDHGIVTLN